MDNKSEVFNWLRSISLDETMKLETKATFFEQKGFISLRSLMFLKVTDLEEIFSEGGTLLLAEQRVLEFELQKLQAGVRNTVSTKSQVGECFENSTPVPRLISSQPHRPLDQKHHELSQNVQLLEVQVKSATEHINSLKERYEHFQPLASFRQRLCSKCHTTGHSKSTCSSTVCTDVTSCKVRDKHPELKTEISELQSELKQLQKNHDDAKKDLETFALSRQRAATNFFSVMRPRLKATNLHKYANRSDLDNDLLVLERALGKKVPDWDESQDWQLPLVIEKYKQGPVRSLMSTV